MVAGDPLQLAEGLSAHIQSLSQEMEDNGRIDDGVAQAIADAGIQAMSLPAVLGGAEASPAEILDVVSALAYADGSTGWATMASQAAIGVFGATMPEAGIKAILASDNYLMAGLGGPTGTARRVDGGYIVKGRHAFASGSAHAGWIHAGFFEVDENGKLLKGPNGGPIAVTAIFPRSKVNLLGNWDVLGLVATTSVDYEVPEQFVSDDFAFDATQIQRGGPLYAMGLKALTGTGHAGFALGVAKRALDEFKVLAQTSKRPPAGTLNMHDTIQRDFARWHAIYKSSKAFIYDSYTTLYEVAKAGGDKTPELQADCRLSLTDGTYRLAEMVREVYMATGSQGLRNGSVIQRCMRDLHAGTQHMLTNEHIYVEAGRVYLDVPGLTPAHTQLMTVLFTPPLP
ncbi:MAG: hypothetical protein JWP10_1519 [Nocardioidaceae bacterium]|nr:hypothetical protein [Nocardioidaceae bacterium]